MKVRHVSGAEVKVREEDSVPVAERYLWVEGIVEAAAYTLIKEGLSGVEDATTMCCFIGFAYADIPLGKTFERVCSGSDPRRSTRTQCVVRAVTQQFSKPFDEIPHGWKTICALAFPSGVPDLIAQLPVVSAWYESPREQHVLLCSEETWRALCTTVTLFRPVGQQELDLIHGSGDQAFPPRLPFQPIFYPVLTEEYAVQIARDWNTRDAASGYVGYVTRFRVRASFLERYTIQTVGTSRHREYWIPAEDLVVFNEHIVGRVEVTAVFHNPGTST